jgi:hypothetical protein
MKFRGSKIEVGREDFGILGKESQMYGGGGYI